MKNFEQIYGLNLHKDEYNTSFVLWLKENFKYDKDTETAKQLYIYGTKEQIDKVMSLMYKSAEECSQVFPQFNTIEDEYEEFIDSTKYATMTLTDAYLKFANSPAFQGGEILDIEQLKVRQEIANHLLAMRALMMKIN